MPDPEPDDVDVWCEVDKKIEREDVARHARRMGGWKESDAKVELGEHHRQRHLEERSQNHDVSIGRTSLNGILN